MATGNTNFVLNRRAPTLLAHQGVRHASWKGLALARFQVGLAVILLNTLKWYKIRHGQLRPMTLKPAA